VSSDGTLAAAAADTPAAVTIRLTHVNLLELMAGGANAWRSAEVEGDAEFAAAIAQVAANLRWDAEEDLSRVVGDIAAYRLAGVGRAAAAWPRQAVRSMAENASEYLTEEAQVLVTPLQASEFVREVDELRDATERLEKRIERLARLNAGT
jgi:ubiquinone biosynthesis protein UbiJ